MMMIYLAPFILGFLAVSSVVECGGPLPSPFTEHCIVGERSLYPPPENTTVPYYVISLDAEPAQRWREVATVYKEQIKNLLQGVKDLLVSLIGEKVVLFLEAELAKLDGRLAAPYADELAGIANATGCPLGDIVLYNIFYEAFTACTSIVAQDDRDRLYHARNLDFGIFLGWNPKTHDWTITERLRKTIVNLEWKRAGKTIFKSVNFAGFIGVYNGVRPQRFTVTANERFDANGGYMGILKWLMGDRSANWMTLLVREVMEKSDSYETSVDLLSKTPVIAPVYYIVGGNSSGQGSIIARSRHGIVDIRRLNASSPNGWYLLQTNYDPAKKPPFFDDRRTPGNECMRKLGRKQVGFEGLFNVLSSTTNLNKLTAYTTLMRVDTGAMETYIQKCPDPCWPW